MGGEAIPITGDLRYEVTTDRSVAEAVAAIGEALARRRFSVLWDLDVGAKLAEKGLDLRMPYRILEVCSAPRAKQALETNPAVGYFLPCKVVVYEAGGRTHVGLPRPQALIGLVGDPRLGELAAEVEAALVAAVDEVGRA
jgi:uncharacterized protein (DUF302 family)